MLGNIDGIFPTGSEIVHLYGSHHPPQRSGLSVGKLREARLFFDYRDYLLGGSAYFCSLPLPSGCSFFAAFSFATKMMACEGLYFPSGIPSTCLCPFQLQEFLLSFRRLRMDRRHQSFGILAFGFAGVVDGRHNVVATPSSERNLFCSF